MDSYRKLCLEKVSEYDQEIPQSHNADQPMALLARDTEHKTATRRQKNKVKQPALSSSARWVAKLDTKNCITK